MQSRQSLEFRQQQQLALTPQLQQSIRFLQLSAHDLEKEIADALLENPMLEPDDEYDINVISTIPAEPDSASDPWPVLALPNRSGSRSAWDQDSPVFDEREPPSLRAYLLEQLHLTRATDRDRALITILIEELDENGYLSTPLQEVLACLPTELDIGLDELHSALCLLQSFDPAGIAATSPTHCLLLQLERPDANPAVLAASPAVRSCTRQILQHHLGLLASGNLNRLRDVLSCSLTTLRAAHVLLLSLNPRPGLAWADTTADYVNPEVLIRKVKGQWRASLNPAVMPRLRVSPMYEQVLRRDNNQGPLRNHMQQAHGLIKGLAQRFDTILRVSQAIVDRQQPFFEHGMSAMRPLLLRDIAAALNMHESTVSRATRQKFAQTPIGMVELKRFFGAALVTDSGTATSASAVRSLIVELIDKESAIKPLSDNQIAAKLSGHGVVVARRTVAKYREAAGIEVSTLRKARAALEFET